MEEKEAQREACLARRRALSPADRARNSAAICRWLESLSALAEAGTILSYLATAEEADLSAFHAWALAKGKRLAFPVSGAEGRMEAYLPRTAGDWERGRFGILAPVPARAERVAPEALDAVILPCVGFDDRGGRLGHGGGYYDRYLPRCPQAETVLAAFGVQRLERVALGPEDRPVRWLVTESGPRAAAGT